MSWEAVLSSFFDLTRSWLGLVRFSNGGGGGPEVIHVH